VSISNSNSQSGIYANDVRSALLAYRLNSSTPETAPSFALVNAGGIRASIDEGPITRGEVLTAFPFSNAVVDVTMSGERLWAVLEGIISRVNVDNGKAVTSFLQVSSGVRIEYAPVAANSTSNVLVSVTIGDKPLDMAAEYTIVTVDFIAGGGDNMLSPPFENLVVLDTMDAVLTRHIGATSPVDIALDGRLKVVSRCKGAKAARLARARRSNKD
jgi:5'-nucleotidase